jgi:hypothetical protein
MNFKVFYTNLSYYYCTVLSYYYCTKHMANPFQTTSPFLLYQPHHEDYQVNKLKDG